MDTGMTRVCNATRVNRVSVKFLRERVWTGSLSLCKIWSAVLYEQLFKVRNIKKKSTLRKNKVLHFHKQLSWCDLGLICVSVEIYQSSCFHQLLIHSQWHKIHFCSGYLGPEPHAVHVIYKFMETTSLCKRIMTQYIMSLVFDVTTVNETSPWTSVV